MKSSNNWMRSGLVLAVGTVCIALVLSSGAQVQTTTTTTRWPEQPDSQGRARRGSRGERQRFDRENGRWLDPTF